MAERYFAHNTADVSPQAIIGDGTKIWQHCQVREGAVLGHDCILSQGVYIDAGVHIGNNVKIQNGISVYHGVALEDGVFCGPHCVFTNDRQPRAIGRIGPDVDLHLPGGPKPRGQRLRRKLGESARTEPCVVRDQQTLARVFML